MWDQSHFSQVSQAKEFAQVTRSEDDALKSSTISMPHPQPHFTSAPQTKILQIDFDFEK